MELGAEASVEKKRLWGIAVLDNRPRMRRPTAVEIEFVFLLLASAVFAYMVILPLF